ncbi:MAG: homocysteine S-methyltransferase family protein [Oscillospiraceae bacterium]|jgi:5-methyltetrahydrofolate--homocysteine methyltransferase|nr:homocysteine S-methyltransferase family protein [Oscillospiraceae bacterium]
MKFSAAELTRQQPLFWDGAMGTQLQSCGLAPGQPPETWNLTHPEEVVQIHRAYLAAGVQVIKANTFGANRLKYPRGGAYALEDVIAAGFTCAHKAIAEAGAEAFVALDIGSCGKLLEPVGTLAFEDAVALFREVAALGAAHGADLILIETMTDSLEAKAAILGAKEGAPGLPVCATLTFEANGRLLTGGTPAAAAVLLEGLGVDALGVNCGAGPLHAAQVLPDILRTAHVPVICCPNAGLPGVQDGAAAYDLTPEAFAEQMEALFDAGVSVFGGCCGTTPAHMRALTQRLRGRTPRPPQNPRVPVVASAAQVVAFGGKPVLIGERINPTGKPTFQKALREGDLEYIENAAVTQAQAGAHVLDVNVGLPGLDEAATMRRVVARVEQAVNLPLQIDSTHLAALEAGLRQLCGKALINSLSGKRHSLETVLPLAKRYGGVVVALLLDEEGIPATVEGRMAIAERIYATAAEYGLGKADILIDALTLTVSSEPDSPAVTLEVVRRIRAMGGWTVLGVSNISFGLPRREPLNAAFFTMAMQAGLSAAILNPNAEAMRSAYHCFCLLNKLDPGCEEYLAYTAALPVAAPGGAVATQQSPRTATDDTGTLTGAILAGRLESAERLAQEALAQQQDPLDVLQSGVLPALDEAGKCFAAGSLFLPQLLRSAAAAKAALALVQAAIRASGKEAASRGTIVLATVQGDIHDIGKNIVKTLLETYHFTVIDLGKDVPPATVLAAVLEHHAPLCGLSALMTTTVPGMEATIRLLHEQAPFCRVLVGGAVLNQSYADAIGADAYCSDAMEGIRAAERLALKIQ